MIRRACHPTDRVDVVADLHNLAAARWQDLAGATVEVKPNESARRSTKVRDTRHRLLTAVAALVQLHRRPDPAQLVRDRAVVGLETEPWPPGGHPKCLESEDAGRRAGAIGRGRERQKIRAGNENLPPGDIVELRDRPCSAWSRAARRIGSHTTAQSAVTSSTSTRKHESHRRKEIDERLGVRPFHVNPDRCAVVDELQVMLDVALRTQNQSLRTDARSQPFDALRRQVVQPGQPIDAADPDDAALRQIDEASAVRQLPLFAERIAVVRGHSCIEGLVDECQWAYRWLPPPAGRAMGCDTPRPAHLPLPRP